MLKLQAKVDLKGVVLDGPQVISLKIGDRVVGTATVHPDGTATGQITDAEAEEDVRRTGRLDVTWVAANA